MIFNLEALRDSVGQVTQGSMDESSINLLEGAVLFSIGLLEDGRPQFFARRSVNVAEGFASFPEEEVIVDDDDVFLS